MPTTTARSGDAAAGSDFAPLLRLVRERGLLDRRPGWFAATIGLNLAALAAIAVAIQMAGDSWWTLLLALPAAVFWTRTAFIGHDAGHGQVATSRRVGRAVALVHGNLLLGMSCGWWNDKHNRHHANPNHVEKDPDVRVGTLVWTQRQAALREGFSRWLTRNQAWLFFPMLLLEGLNLKVSGIRDLKRQGRRERTVEASLMLLHLGGYSALLLTSMSLGTAVAFALLHHALFGLHLGMAFAPNHKGMEMPDPDAERWDFLRRQVLTARNVRGGPITDALFGGLNYQIEHHLFPGMPRPNLRIAQPLVREHCEALGVSYAETGVIDSYRLALRHMRDVGAPLRTEGAGVVRPDGAPA